MVIKKVAVKRPKPTDARATKNIFMFRKDR